jgi:hypothetical protein
MCRATFRWVSLHSKPTPKAQSWHSVATSFQLASKSGGTHTAARFRWSEYMLTGVMTQLASMCLVWAAEHTAENIGFVHSVRPAALLLTSSVSAVRVLRAAPNVPIGKSPSKSGIQTYFHVPDLDWRANYSRFWRELEVFAGPQVTRTAELDHTSKAHSTL